MTPESHVLACILGGDAPTRSLLRFLLASEGCTVREADTVRTLNKAVQPADVRLLLVAADHVTDIRLLADLHRAGYRAPTILIGYSVSPEVRRQALALGVADVIKIPADTRSLQSRVRAALTHEKDRTPSPDKTVIHAGGLTLDMDAHTVRAEGGRPIHLTPNEARLLSVLMQTPGKATGRHTLLDRVWSANHIGDVNALEVYICRLRAKLSQVDPTRQFVHTAYKEGYLFDARSQTRLELVDEKDGNPRVLIIDDDPPIVDMVREALEMANYTVADGVGPEALILARRLRPSVILLDLMMPGMSGMEVCRQLAQNPRTAEIPVIAMSAGKNLRTHVDEMGAADYLAKPFDVDELLLRVGKLAGTMASRLPVMSDSAAEMKSTGSGS